MNGVSTGFDNAAGDGFTLIKALCNADAYDHEIAPVRIVETHISWVLLTGRYAYKIKKPVCFGFLDFSTLEKRRFFCSEEIRLNRRLAADIYLETVPITGTAAAPKVGGAGAAIEYAVKMIQFPEGRLLSARAEKEQWNGAEIDQIARIVADFHAVADQAADDSYYGDAADIRHWFDENFEQIRPLLANAGDRQQLQSIQCWGDSEWSDKSALMRLRKQQGYVRECHGDLHLSNITLIDGKATLFDCIEFNPMLRWIDVISEVAFLVIDLLYFGYESHAFRFLNRYFQQTGDYQGLGLLRYYLVYRALVLAKVALLRMQQCQGGDYRQAQEKFGAFMNLAERFTKTGESVLMITHGYSGSGKSTFAIRLADKTRALLIRSDIERKRLFGYRAQDKTGSGIDGGIYTQEAAQRTYQRLAELARLIINAGFSVIVDAAFLKKWQRDLFRQAADEAAVQFVILNFQVSEDILSERIRQRDNDASEATVEVLQNQCRSSESLSEQELADVMTIDFEIDNDLDRWLERVDGHLLQKDKCKA